MVRVRNALNSKFAKTASNFGAAYAQDRLNRYYCCRFNY